MGLLATAMYGCSVTCTLVGCLNGVFITFDSPPPLGTVVQLEFPLAPPWRIECDVDETCSYGVYFPDLHTGSLAIRIITPTAEVLRLVSPEYVASWPNGRGCGPGCFRADVEVALP